MKTVILDTGELYLKAAGIIRELLYEKPDAVLAMSAGRTMNALWDELARLCAAGEPDMSACRILAVTEYVEVPDDLKSSCAFEKGLLERLHISPDRFFCPDAEKPEEYDGLIEKLGGIDLAVLGIGDDAHIGYNEPGTLFNTKTHIQKLTDRTKRQLLAGTFSEDSMPEYAVTMGIQTIVSAKRIMLLAAGEEKAAPVYQMMYAKTMPYIPASYLQIPAEVYVLLDKAAASAL